MQSVSLTLPIEVWELILDLLDTKSLLNFQHSCHAWRNIILNYVMRGRIRDRALVRIKALEIRYALINCYLVDIHWLTKSFWKGQNLKL